VVALRCALVSHIGSIGIHVLQPALCIGAWFRHTAHATKTESRRTGRRREGACTLSTLLTLAPLATNSATSFMSPASAAFTIDESGLLHG
jgi:hypothetical protein